MTTLLVSLFMVSLQKKRGKVHSHQEKSSDGEIKSANATIHNYIDLSALLIPKT